MQNHGLFANSGQKSVKDDNRYHLAIIGGGPAGVSNFVQLVKMIEEDGLSKRIKITIIEKDKERGIGPGLPFSTHHDCHILNLPIAAMSPIPKKQNEFAKWLDENKNNGENWIKIYPDYEFPNDQYPPRSLYGLYLKSLYKQTLAKARQAGIIVNEVFDEAIDIRDRCKDPSFSESFEIAFKNRPFISVDQAACFIGHLKTTTYLELENFPCYYSDPWNYAEFDNIPTNEEITILGSRLSAIDVFLYLKEVKGHEGNISFVSRSGLLPAVIAETQKDNPTDLRYYPKVMTLDTLYKEYVKLSQNVIPLKDMMSLFWRELNGIYTGNYDEELPKDKQQKLLKPSLGAKEWLEKFIAKSAANVKWQAFLLALYEVLPKFWERLSAEDQFNFLEYYNSIFMTYLAAFPRKNAEKLLKYINNGQLNVLGGLERVSYDQREEEFVLRLAGNEELRTNHLINATGPGYNINDSLLFRNMVTRGIIRPKIIKRGHREKIVGVDVDSETLEVFAENGNTIPRLRVVGEQSHGALYTTTDQGQVATLAFRATKAELEVLKKDLNGQENAKQTSAKQNDTDTCEHGEPVTLLANALSKLLIYQSQQTPSGYSTKSAGPFKTSSARELRKVYITPKSKKPKHPRRHSISGLRSS